MNWQVCIAQVYHRALWATYRWPHVLPQPSQSLGQCLDSLIDMRSHTVTLSIGVQQQAIVKQSISLMAPWGHTLWEVSMKTAGTPSLLEPSTLQDQPWQQLQLIPSFQVKPLANILAMPCMQREGVKWSAMVSVRYVYTCIKVKSEWHLKANLLYEHW